MSTRSTKKWKCGKHAKISERTKQIIEQKKRLAGASLALMLSVSSAAVTESATLAFAAESDGEATTETANTPESLEAPEVSAEMIPLAGSSVTACARALTADLGTGASLVDVATYDPAAERAEKVETLIESAYAYLGTPYRYGGTTPAGFDCSGFTGYVYNEALGMELPRSAAAQSGLAEPISLDEAQRGDLLFWGGRGVYHTGIYLGDGQYIHAAASGCVKIQDTGSYTPSFAMRLI